MNKLKQLWMLALVILFSFKGLSSAQPFINVASSNDGNGLFSYTFTLGSPTYAWGLSLNNGSLQMHFNGLQGVFNPAGWTSSTDANNLVTWTRTDNNLTLLGSPSITFSIQSSYTQSTLYNQSGLPGDLYPRGVMVGGVYEISTLNGVTGGYETFSYFGPTSVPEPTTAALIAVTLIGFCGRKLRETS